MLDKLEQDLIVIDLKEEPQRYGRVIGNSKLYVIISNNSSCIIWHPDLSSTQGWPYKQKGFEGWKGWYTNNIRVLLQELCSVLYPETIELINKTLRIKKRC
jgi:hypothetical protein